MVRKFIGAVAAIFLALSLSGCSESAESKLEKFESLVVQFMDTKMKSIAPKLATFEYSDDVEDADFYISGGGEIWWPKTPATAAKCRTSLGPAGVDCEVLYSDLGTCRFSYFEEVDRLPNELGDVLAHNPYWGVCEKSATNNDFVLPVAPEEKVTASKAEIVRVLLESECTNPNFNVYEITEMAKSSYFVTATELEDKFVSQRFRTRRNLDLHINYNGNSNWYEISKTSDETWANLGCTNSDIGHTSHWINRELGE